MNKQDEEKAKQILDCEHCPFQSISYCKECEEPNDVLKMAAWKEEQMIEKAVKWLGDNLKSKGSFILNIDKWIEDFKQAMKEE